MKNLRHVSYEIPLRKFKFNNVRVTEISMFKKEKFNCQTCDCMCLNILFRLEVQCLSLTLIFENTYCHTRMNNGETFGRNNMSMSFYNTEE